jgi:ankyrin repeat protein
MHQAAMKGSKGCLEVLLQAKQSFSSIDLLCKKEGKSPLHYAAWNKKGLCVALLIQYGANLDLQDLQNCATALHYVGNDTHW